MAYQAPHNPLEVPHSFEKPYKDIKNKDRRRYAGKKFKFDINNYAFFWLIQPFSL